MSDKIEVHYNGDEDGDWTVIKVNGEVFTSGHDVPLWELVDLLRKLGHEVDYQPNHTNDSIMDLL